MSKYTNKYAVRATQCSFDSKCLYTLSGVLELRMLNATTKRQAVQVAKDLMMTRLNMKVFVVNPIHDVWKEEPEFWGDKNDKK